MRSVYFCQIPVTKSFYLKEANKLSTHTKTSEVKAICVDGDGHTYIKNKEYAFVQDQECFVLD